MTTKPLSRSQKAMQLERRTGRTWRACRDGVRIPSRTVADRAYVVTETSCTCGDAYFRGARCLHQIALAIAIARYDSRQRAARGN